MFSHKAYEKGSCQPLPQPSVSSIRVGGDFNTKILYNNQGFKEEGIMYGREAGRDVSLPGKLRSIPRQGMFAYPFLHMQRVPRDWTPLPACC